jgi:hypothetical protein
MVSALAQAVDDFLIGENGPQRGTPVHEDLRLRRKPTLEETKEYPLRPSKVLLIGGR